MSAEMLERLKSSIASLINAMHVIHSAATQADRALHLQPGELTLFSLKCKQWSVSQISNFQIVRRNSYRPTAKRDDISMLIGMM